MHLWKALEGRLECRTTGKFEKASRRLRSEPRVDLEKECSRQGQLQVQSHPSKRVPAGTVGARAAGVEWSWVGWEH